MIMPYKIYSYDCPYCGKEGSILFMTNRGDLVENLPPEGAYGARCSECGEAFAINWDKHGNYFSDFNEAFKKFMNEYVCTERRDIDEFLLSDISILKKEKTNGCT